MKNKFIAYMFVGGLLMGTSCSDFLDTMPDNRVEVNLAEQITPLLVSAYPSQMPLLIGELSSDNVIDNGGQFDAEKIQQQLYLWQDVTEVDMDSPTGIWESCYNAIASANQALQGIERLGNTSNLQGQKGEALLCRAYSHFILSNIFCMAYNPQTAEQELGIPYCTEPETQVSVKYDRGTLAETYAMIEKDLEAGLPLITDSYYSVPKYHFNKRAANAFAARFYLYYQKWDKALACANAALGTDPSAVLRQWEADFGNISSVSDIENMYISEKKSANFFIAALYSTAPYYTGPYDIYKRYGHGQEVYLNEGLGANGLWNAWGGLVMSNYIITVHQKNPFPKMTVNFEYIDKTSGIGYPHAVTVPFTSDETLLTRAEAHVLGEHNYAAALSDINLWIKYHSSLTAQGRDLTLDDIQSAYSRMSYAPIVINKASDRSIKKKLNPQGFVVNAGVEESLIQLILQLRRLDTLQEGLRWQDLKRYGIEFSHNRVGDTPDVLLKDDPRRAIQLPQDVVNAGLTPNPRY